MKVISNSDYDSVKRLLRGISQRKGVSVREDNAARLAQLLLRKWSKNDTK